MTPPSAIDSNAITRRLRTGLVVLLAACLTSARAGAQHGMHMPGAPAVWVADTGVAADGYGVFHFRRVIDLPARPRHFLVRVSADNRYRLLVNGQHASSGPQRADIMHWRYENVDLAAYLHAGRNVLAATVWNWGVYRPVGQLSRRTAFLVQAVNASDAMVNTGEPGWKMQRDSGYAPIPVTGPATGGYYAAPPGEMLDARRFPWGWESVDFADTNWSEPGALEEAQFRGSDHYGVVSTWQLETRTLPQMRDSLVRFATVRRAEGLAPDDHFLRGDGDLVVPAQSRVVLLLDQKELTNAYFAMETSGGAGATVEMTYAESLRDSSGRKGNRDAIEGKTIVGVRDMIRLDGGAHRQFRTLWFRTWRYVQLEIRTAGEPVRIHDVHGFLTGYPYHERGHFTSDAPWIDSVWTMNWRTARLCAWETHFDTPYYEQLQYVGDTRIQSLIAMYVAGDDRLVRNAIEQFDQSRIADGLTASRYPSALPQYIPPFSLLWVAMVHDHWMLRDETAFVRSFLPGTRAVLDWFGQRVDSTGLLGALPWWGFVDWTDAWERGVPPGGETGHSVAVSLQYVYALDRAAQLEDALGIREIATRYRARAAAMRAAVRARAWNSARGLFRDSPDSALYSQQTNALAVLAGAVPLVERRALVERMLSDTTLVRASYYFDFYVFEAMRDAGLGDRYVEQLAPWRAMLAMGLTTTPENPEPTRSDSHAWSAHPDYGLLATVLGVRPASPGFHTVLVAPHLGSLMRAEGTIPHPHGDIVVRLTRAAGDRLHAEVTLPANVTGTLEWRGRTARLRPGAQQITL